MNVKHLLRAGAMALVLLFASPASTQQPITPPLISEATKFPREDPDIIRAVSAINQLVNANMTYVPDTAHYGEEEKWVMMPSDGMGDCEDYALTKMELLRQAGAPVIAITRIRGVLVVEGGKILGAHAILEMLLPNGTHVFLDNRFSELMTRSELERAGYHFFDW